MRLLPVVVVSAVAIALKQAFQLVLTKEYAIWAPALARALVRIAGFVYWPRREQWRADLEYVQQIEGQSGLLPAGWCVMSAPWLTLHHVFATFATTLLASSKRSELVVDTTVPHSARIWNYWIGGKDNYAVDRAAGDQIRQICPCIVDMARADREFIGRAIRYLVDEAGIRQFLDIGTGLPTLNSTHEVAQRFAPESRIVYVDNDPLVLVYARTLLTSTPEGATDYIDADLRDPSTILAAAAKTLDFTQPIALMLIGIVGHIVDNDEAYRIVKELLNALPPDSYLALSDGTNTDPELIAAAATYTNSGALPYHLRSPEEIAHFFDGLELVEPGVVSIPLWRPDPKPYAPREIPMLVGVGRKSHRPTAPARCPE